MSTLYFFSTTEAAQIIWRTHYYLQLPVNGPTCCTSKKEITNTQTGLTNYVFMLQKRHPTTQINGKEASAYKQLMIIGSGTVLFPYPQPTLFPNPPYAFIRGLQKAALDV
jgi:hypothetical protein